MAHVRRCHTGKREKKQSLYLVDVILKERPVTFYADTGAEVSVIPKSLAKELGIPVAKNKNAYKTIWNNKTGEMCGLLCWSLDV